MSPETLKLGQFDEKVCTFVIHNFKHEDIDRRVFFLFKITHVLSDLNAHLTTAAFCPPRTLCRGGSVKKTTTEPCSIRCVGVMGLIPSLQCRLCLCLYHPECVGLGTITETIHSYVCKVSVVEQNDNSESLSHQICSFMAINCDRMIICTILMLSASHSLN